MVCWETISILPSEPKVYHSNHGNKDVRTTLEYQVATVLERHEAVNEQDVDISEVIYTIFEKAD